jgi:hypothetical protein
MPERSFRGVTALVTGASFGIGEDFARQLAQAGANLILTARSKDRLEKLAAELKQAHGIAAHFFPGDLSRLETPRLLFEAIRQQGLEVDLLINNAGFGRGGPFEDVDVETDNAMLMVNVHSLVALTHLFIPEMLARKKGGIINVASTAGFQPLPFFSLYAATKAFVISFTEALWAEYEGRGIRVLCLCPGNTDTDFDRRAGLLDKSIFLVGRSEDVVRQALKVYAETNRPTTIHGWGNRFLTLGYRLFPREWMIRIARLIYKP